MRSELESPSDARSDEGANSRRSRASRAPAWLSRRTGTNVTGEHVERRVVELDGLRALSFLSVFQMHLPGQSGGAWFGYAVDVFFVLSAYLLGSRLLAEREATGTLDVRRFYKRRIFRIWPLYYIVLAVAWAVCGPADRRLLPAFAGFFGNFLVGAQGHWPAPILVPLWSLCVEEQFYLAVPWLVRSRRT